jgi:hypothetical protein
MHIDIYIRGQRKNESTAEKWFNTRGECVLLIGIMLEQRGKMFSIYGYRFIYATTTEK